MYLLRDEYNTSPRFDKVETDFLRIRIDIKNDPLYIFNNERVPPVEDTTTWVREARTDAVPLLPLSGRSGDAPSFDPKCGLCGIKYGAPRQDGEAEQPITLPCGDISGHECVIESLRRLPHLCPYCGEDHLDWSVMIPIYTDHLVQ